MSEARRQFFMPLLAVEIDLTTVALEDLRAAGEFSRSFGMLPYWEEPIVVEDKLAMTMVVAFGAV